MATPEHMDGPADGPVATPLGAPRIGPTDPPAATSDGPTKVARHRGVDAAAIAIPAVLAGIVDAAIAHDGGRSWASAIGAGAGMALFVALGVWWIRRVTRGVKARRQTQPVGVGGWANPTSPQRVAGKWARYLRTGGGVSRENPLAGGSRRRRR